MKRFITILLLNMFLVLAINAQDSLDINANDENNSASLNLLFSQDSIKHIIVQATAKDAQGNIIPLKDETINLYVSRTFSLLKIGEQKSDAEGKAEFVFPENLPGDSLGNVKIITKIEEHEVYGNIEKSENKTWGVPAKNYRFSVESPSLSTEFAPTWMLVVLTILLCGVWGHYLYVIFKLWEIFKYNKIN